MVLCLLAVIIAALIVKIILMKKAAEEISDQLGEKLSSDTNTTIGISSSDRDMRRLTDELNVQLRELRRQKNRYDQGDSELKSAVTNISHDLRTPLTAISSYLDLLESDPSKAEEYLPVLRERTEALAQLTEELFRYSVITSPDRESCVEEISVNRVLEESILAYYAPLQERGITPEIDITAEQVIRRVDRGELSRVFSNLLNNAMKYSDGDLRISLTSEGCITFSNSAEELSKIQAERLFDRFYTIENARKSTGLGLSIAKVLVERMGGTIEAEYREGQLSIRIVLR